MKKSIIILLVYCFCITAKSQNKYFEIYTDSIALKNQNNELIHDIETKIKRIDPSFSFNGLTTEIPTTFMYGQYRTKTNKIYLQPWQIGGPPMESFLTEVTGSYDKGNSLAALFFYGFFLPHEVGHAFQYHTKNLPKNAYDEEYQANEFAVLYWRSNGKQKELEQCYEMAKLVLTKLKNPIPDNVDAKQYMTDHYDELVKDPYKYGFIQFSQIVKVIEDKSLPNFEIYVKQKTSKKVKNN